MYYLCSHAIILSEEENWRNKNPRKKVVTKSRRAIHSMLNPSVEPSRTLIILRNGYLTIAKDSIQTSRTCASDSAFTIFAAMYADCEQVKTQIDQIEPSTALLKMVKSMFDTNKSLVAKQNNLLRQRNQIMMDLFENMSGMKKLEGVDFGQLFHQCELSPPKDVAKESVFIC